MRFWNRLKNQARRSDYGLAIPKVYPPRQRRLSQPRKERHFAQCRRARRHHDHLRARSERDVLDSRRRNFLYHQMRKAPAEERRDRHWFRFEQYRTLDNRTTGAGCCSLGAPTFCALAVFPHPNRLVVSLSVCRPKTFEPFKQRIPPLP